MKIDLDYNFKNDLKELELKNELTDTLDERYIITRNGVYDGLLSDLKLIVNGISGSGKTSIMRYWAKERGVSLVEIDMKVVKHKLATEDVEDVGSWLFECIDNNIHGKTVVLFDNAVEGDEDLFNDLRGYVKDIMFSKSFDNLCQILFPVLFETYGL